MAHCLTQPRQGAVGSGCEYRCSVSPRKRAMSLSHTNGDTAAGGHELSKGGRCVDSDSVGGSHAGCCLVNATTRSELYACVRVVQVIVRDASSWIGFERNRCGEILVVVLSYFL